MDRGVARPRHQHHQLKQLIAGLDDGIILVGFDQTILSANERALSMHGVKSVDDLGADIDQYRSRFRLAYRDSLPIGEGDFPIERVIAGERPREVMVEVRPLNEPDDPWTHAIRCLVITDEDGTPDYLVLVINDETNRYEAEDRFESAFNANPAPAIICRLADLRFVRVNQGFLDMTGCDRDEIVGRSVYELDILAGVADRDAALKQLRAWETICQSEALLSLPDGSQRSVIVAGQPIEVSDERCMLFTFADLEPRRRAETALLHSEERFSKAFTLSPVAATICSLDRFQFMEVNEAFTRLTGYSRDQAVGRDAIDLNLWLDRSAQAGFDRTLETSGSVPGMDVRIRTSDGESVDCLFAAETITIDNVRCVLCVMQDITFRKRTETELIAAIETVMSDTSWFSRSIVEKLAGLRQPSQMASAGADLDQLSDRERDVLGLICQGLPDAEIADALCLSRHTIRNHLSSLYRKIGVRRRGAAAVWARERGVIGKEVSKPGRTAKKS